MAWADVAALGAGESVEKWGEERLVAGVASPAVISEDDPADGWFPESVAAGYDAPGGANSPEVVTLAVRR
ncbi:hypothetical protein SAMN04489732_101884 [Amycolatopsis saalfeldensis]|uniref:Uncharacterized protein n=1 Tax=Amycolatopsis saalfeldensis TaxID=394193 RepID=A0A1H8RPJ8_9PSEU|nr:hypothetical protein SAMN04489732_101884 [Amycolatopsis saalfeldensis]